MMVVMTRAHDCPFHPRACRVTVIAHPHIDLIGWTPVYDGTGVMVNADPNATIHEYDCTVCGRQWLARTQYGQTEIFRTVKPLTPVTSP